MAKAKNVEAVERESHILPKVVFVQQPHTHNVFYRIGGQSGERESHILPKVVFVQQPHTHTLTQVIL